MSNPIKPISSSQGASNQQAEESKEQRISRAALLNSQEIERLVGSDSGLLRGDVNDPAKVLRDKLSHSVGQKTQNQADK